MVGLVPCAVGGTEIDEWREGSHLFNQMVGLASSKTGKGAQAGFEANLRVIWIQNNSINGSQNGCRFADGPD